MKALKERALFWKQALEDMQAVGSVTPSSQAVAKAMTGPMRDKQGPRRILEVGAGTGPITARIVRDMRPGDSLDVYEVNEKYTDFLKRRFDEEEAFRRVRDQSTVYTDSVENVPQGQQYDIIISAVPFTVFEPPRVEAFFETYRRILADDGVLTYIEFAFGRQIMRVFAKQEEKQRLAKIGRIVDRYIDNYQQQHRFVLLNAPPARIRSLQFD